jgi:hypothetical protein
MPKQTTRFRVWLQDAKVIPVWTGIKLVGPLKSVVPGSVDVTVAGDGSDLKRLIAERQDIFAAYLEMRAEEH